MSCANIAGRYASAYCGYWFEASKGYSSHWCTVFIGTHPGFKTTRFIDVANFTDNFDTSGFEMVAYLC